MCTPLSHTAQTCAQHSYRQQKTCAQPNYTQAKIIFGGKFGNPFFCHINGMERPIFFWKKGRYWLHLGFEIGLNEKLSMCKET